MALSTAAGLEAAIAGAQIIDSYYPSVTAVASTYTSMWTAASQPGGTGATPASGSGAVPTNTTAGAIPFTNPNGSNTMYLAGAKIHGLNAQTPMLIDRLVHTSGLSGTSTSAQTVSSAALTRTYNGNANTELWLEWYTATGSTAVTATVSYTNQAGTSGQSGTASIPASTAAGRCIPVTLAAGDTGVKAVASVTLSASTLTAGNFGITIVQKIALLPINPAGIVQVYDWASCGLPVIQPSACLNWYIFTATTSSAFEPELVLAQG